MSYEDFGNVRFTIVHIKTIVNGKKIKLILAKQDRMGCVDTSYIAAIMKINYNIKHLFMIGVCGGRESQHIKIGDILIPNESFAFQNGKLTKDGLIVDATSSQRNSLIQQLIDKEVEDFIQNKYSEYMKEQIDLNKPVEIYPPKIYFESIACGDVVVDKPGELDEIATRLSKRKLVGIDMESYSIFRASYIFPELKTTVIKGVMDITTGKSDKFKDFAATIVSDFLIYILKNEKYLIN